MTFAKTKDGQFSDFLTAAVLESTNTHTPFLHDSYCELSVLVARLEYAAKPTCSISWLRQVQLAGPFLFFLCMLFHHRPCYWWSLVLGAVEAVDDFEAVTFLSIGGTVISAPRSVMSD